MQLGGFCVCIWDFSKHSSFKVKLMFQRIIISLSQISAVEVFPIIMIIYKGTHASHIGIHQGKGLASSKLTKMFPISFTLLRYGRWIAKSGVTGNKWVLVISVWFLLEQSRWSSTQLRLFFFIINQSHTDSKGAFSGTCCWWNESSLLLSGWKMKHVYEGGYGIRK